MKLKKKNCFNCRIPIKGKTVIDKLKMPGCCKRIKCNQIGTIPYIERLGNNAMDKDTKH